MTFYQGQRVICTKRDGWSIDRPGNPTYGEIVTVEDVFSIFMEDELFGAAIIVPTIPGAWFNAEHFRPLPSRKTDISIFTEMLREVEPC
jgi:hypothetical protein